LLPITTVASVSPDRRAVVLTIDRRLLSSTSAAPDAIAGPPPSVEEAADLSSQWQNRVARYLSAGEAEPDQANGNRADQASKQPTERKAARHLLFVSTSRGYLLVEQEGPPPPLGQGIEIPEESGSFRVAKLGRSPLPDDLRICAYLEQTE
jgi:hypothetical protein